jgi:hypothetical protein
MSPAPGSREALPSGVGSREMHEGETPLRHRPFRVRRKSVGRGGEGFETKRVEYSPTPHSRLLTPCPTKEDT